MLRASSAKAVLGVGIKIEFVVAASEVLDEGVSGADHAGDRPFQAPHRPQSGLEPSLIGFH